MVSIVQGSGVDVDVEAANLIVLRDVLTPLFPGVRVATHVPKDGRGALVFPDWLVVVTRTGGVAKSPAHDNPMVTVECWHANGPDAWSLAGAARNALLQLVNERVDMGVRGGVAFLGHVNEIGGPIFHGDPRTDKQRYQFTHTQNVRR